MSKLMSLVRPQKDVDMTEGPIVGHLIRFAIPLLIGNLFQQLYNTVDAWVVGNYVSKEAFAAVGTVGPIINMLIGFFLGLSSGAGVVISQYYGAKKHDKVSETVHTSVLMTLVLGVLFTFVGIGMTPFMLDLMKTPESVLPFTTSARVFSVLSETPAVRSISSSARRLSIRDSIFCSCSSFIWAWRAWRWRRLSRRASPRF